MRNFTGFLVALFLSKNIQEMNLTGSGDGYGKWKLLGEMHQLRQLQLLRLLRLFLSKTRSFCAPQGGADGCSSGGHQTSKAITFFNHELGATKTIQVVGLWHWV
jgi:hypothetical protein